MAQKGPQARQPATERTRACSIPPPGCKEPAKIGRPQASNIVEAGRTREMPGQEGKELPRITLIGLHRLLRQPPLGREGGQPALPLRHQCAVGDHQKLGHVV